jgi:hypothetical protein
VLDQKDVPVTVRVKTISEHKAEGFAVVIVNDFNDAQAAYALNTNVMIGTSRNLDLRFIQEKMGSLKPLEPEYHAFPRARCGHHRDGHPGSTRSPALPNHSRATG